MIHKLLEIIKTLLRDELPDNEISNARINVEVPIGVQNGQTPLIGLYLGEVNINQQSADTLSSAIRPQERKDRFVVDINTPQGPYTLPKTPLEGSLTCQVLFNEGQLGEKQRLMIEKKDFTIDYLNRLMIFSTSIAGASIVRVSYTFPGVFTIREFNQTFFIDIFDTSNDNLERLTSVTNAIVLTNHDWLLAQFNTIDRTQHTIGNYQSEHTLREIRLVQVAPTEIPDTPSLWHLEFAVSGVIKVTKEISSGYGIIEKVISLGKTGQGVDVDVNLM